MKPIILVVILVLSYLVWGGVFTNNVVIKDVFLISVLFSLFYFLFWNYKVLNKQINKSFTFNLIILVTTTISIINLFVQVFSSLASVSLESKFNISEGSAIANDYNFFSLFMLFSLILLNFKSKQNILPNNYPKYLTICLNVLFCISIILSSSRRGIAALLILIIVYGINSITDKNKLKNFKFSFKKTILFILNCTIVLLLFLYLYYIVPKQKISNILYRYALLVGYNNNQGIERFLWKGADCIPKDKSCLIDKTSFENASGCWSKIYAPGTKISHLNTKYGNSIEIERSISDRGGFSLYYVGPKILYYSNHTYRISFKIKLLIGDKDSFNVGWWINDGGKGFPAAASLEKELVPIGDGWFNCISEYTFIDNHADLLGFINSVGENSKLIISDFELLDLDYNENLPRYLFEVKQKELIQAWLDSNNTPWDSLNLVNNGNFQHGLAFWKISPRAAIDIKTANIDGKKCAQISRTVGDGGAWSLYYDGRDVEYLANNEYQIAFKMKAISPKLVPFNVGYWVNEGYGYQIGLKLKIDTLDKDWLEIKAKYTFKNYQKNLMFPINSQIDNSSFYITDISLINLTQKQNQKKQILDSVAKFKKISRFSDRTSRWAYSLELWKTEYKWYNKLFGKGFLFLNQFGEKYLDDPTLSDYPHNPFISILLYSGIIGLLFYFWLLFRVVYLYFKYRYQCGIAFIGFLITFFFAFFSAGSPFDPPIMGFFMLLPFFIHSIHKNDIPKIPEILTNDTNSNNRDK